MNLIILLAIGIPVLVLFYFIFLLWWMTNDLEKKIKEQTKGISELKYKINNGKEVTA